MGCRNLSLFQEMAGHHLKGLGDCICNYSNIVQVDYFSGAHFPCKTLCTGSRLFIEGAAALEWVFEESLRTKCTENAINNKNAFCLPIVLPSLP